METLLNNWDSILEGIKEDNNLSDISFKTWLKPLEVYSIEDDTLYILYNENTDKRTLEYISKKYELFLRVAIAELTNIEYKIVFILPEDSINIKKTEFNQVIDDDNYKKSGLIPRYTFDTFVVGSNNRFAQTAALSVAETPGEVFNPLYIYGGPGLGKTHLMHAIGNFIYSQNRNTKVLYVTSEYFVNEVIENIRSTNSTTQMSKLRDKYRTVDVLMIDDIQFLIGKEQTQEEFFHTFNSLHSQGKQIIITSDRPPKDMVTLEERIRTRFEMGLMADIGEPDYETRMAIIRRLLDYYNISFNNEILEYVANNIRSNIREIEGAINKLKALLYMQDDEITLEEAKRELESIISPNKPKEITSQHIIETVAEYYNLTLDQMVSTSRTKNIVRPRQIAMYLCRRMISSPTDAIGQLLGGRDHSTIIHGSNKIEEEINNDYQLKEDIETLIKKIELNK